LNFESPENINLAKQERWNTIVLKVEGFRDQLGKEIDPGIKGTIVALQALGFETHASCEGHLDHGMKAPWVDIGTVPRDVAPYLRTVRKKIEGLDPDMEKRVQEARKQIFEQRAQMLDFLSEFYDNRRTPVSQRLVLSFYGHSARLINQG